MGKYSYEELCQKSDKELEEIFKAGITPDFKNLLGYEFRGFNVPKITKILGFQKFKKGFFTAAGQKPDGNEVMGFNVLIDQKKDKWCALPSEDKPKRYGFYRVYKVKPSERDNKYPNALLLNYGISRNGIHPARLLRDYLVQVEPDNPDLYLGRAYFALGPLRLFPSFFVLERYNPIKGEIGY
jgi:hypothetical protein